MNAIFGLFNLDGLPAAECLSVMQSSLAFWGRDGAGTWSAGPFGLGCQQLTGTPQAAGERLPLCDDATGLALTAGGRLDNRTELLDQLKIEGGRTSESVSDAELIWGAYRRWGQDCVHHLEGAWHFAIWDERQRRLFLARDHNNNTGLYYYHGPRCFAFASSKKALLALDAVPKQPNLLRVSQVLAAWPGDGIQTAYKHILRLPPAHRMLFTPDRLSIERYWFPENISELHLQSDDEYVEAFLESFTRSVTARLRSPRPVGITLSGGLDSGSVAAVAANLLQARNENLMAFTSTPLSDPGLYTDRRRFGDETELAQATAYQTGIRDHFFIKAEEMTPLAGIERMLWVHDEPGHAAGNQYWLAALLDSARRQEVGVLLTGQMGNAVISWTGVGESLLPAILGNPSGFWQAFEAARSRAGLSRLPAFRRFLLKPLLLPPWFHLRQRWRLGSRAWRAYSAIRPDFARSIGLNQQMAAAGYLPGLSSLDPLQQRLAIIQPGRNILGASWLEKGAAYGLEVRDPTQDRRLIELCLAIPDAQYQQVGMDRWLIRRAMQAYLPDAVRLNTQRGLQAADLGRRVLSSRIEIEAALTQLNQHELARQVLDLPRMQAVLASLERGLTPQNYADCSTILLRGLMAGLFLLRF